jgi:hypothetical protein
MLRATVGWRQPSIKRDTKYATLTGMCARQSWHQPAGERPVRGNRLRPEAASCCDRADGSRYRVLREAMSRGIPRSVDRECAGRNAKSVKVSSPVKQLRSVVAEQVCSSEGSIDDPRVVGTTGVQVRGMYTRLMSEPGRSPAAGAQQTSQRFLAQGQGMKAKFWVSAAGEVRSRRSSGEVG